MDYHKAVEGLELSDIGEKEAIVFMGHGTDPMKWINLMKN